VFNNTFNPAGQNGTTLIFTPIAGQCAQTMEDITIDASVLPIISITGYIMPGRFTDQSPDVAKWIHWYVVSPGVTNNTFNQAVGGPILIL
jgi:hypothetical protein